MPLSICLSIFPSILPPIYPFLFKLYAKHFKVIIDFAGLLAETRIDNRRLCTARAEDQGQEDPGRTRTVDRGKRTVDSQQRTKDGQQALDDQELALYVNYRYVLYVKVVIYYTKILH